MSEPKQGETIAVCPPLVVDGGNSKRMSDQPSREFARKAAKKIRRWAMQLPEEPWSDDDENEATEDIHTHAILPAVEAATKELKAELATLRAENERLRRVVDAAVALTDDGGQLDESSELTGYLCPTLYQELLDSIDAAKENGC